MENLLVLGVPILKHIMVVFFFYLEWNSHMVLEPAQLFFEVFILLYCNLIIFSKSEKLTFYILIIILDWSFPLPALKEITSQTD